MHISDDRLKEFQRIYEETYGQEITLAEARERAQRLLMLYEIISRPLPGEDGPPSSSDPPGHTER
jgi:hypothetical protein